MKFVLSLLLILFSQNLFASNQSVAFSQNGVQYTFVIESTKKEFIVKKNNSSNKNGRATAKSVSRNQYLLIQNQISDLFWSIKANKGKIQKCDNPLMVSHLGKKEQTCNSVIVNKHRELFRVLASVN